MTTPAAEALAERLFLQLLGGLEVLSVELGRRLGLYVALAEGPATPAELARRAGIAERYAREWLEQQAVAGFLAVEGEDEGRRYLLPEGHADVLVEPEAPTALAAVGQALAAVGDTVPAVADAYRSGGGVPYAAFGEIAPAIAAFNRPVFRHELAGWLAAMPDVGDALAAGGRVLDLGCGEGWSTLALARAVPQATVVGVDLDRRSVELATANAADAGLGERVTFAVADAADARVQGPFALVCVFEALHDMGDPVGVLQAVRAALAPGGAVLVADEKVADTFTAPGDELERFNYGWSVLHCLPATMAEHPKIANGTVLRTPTLQSWATAAGFTTTEVLPVDNFLWKLYRLGAGPAGA
jgi:SAM-dependent methyltransferase